MYQKKIISCSPLRTHRLRTTQFLNKVISSCRGFTFQTCRLGETHVVICKYRGQSLVIEYLINILSSLQHSLNLNFIFSADLQVFGLNRNFNEWNPFWATCFSAMAFLIIVENHLSQLQHFSEKKFRKRPQFLLISLASSDLLVRCAATLQRCRFL